ncbi:uncharacterized protein [Temnothorax longispinosus]|uniref:uncharacterized protein n=1 Tax=Temnothorax longispinosus TaxID=300112 RepID=UPI003A990B59
MDHQAGDRRRIEGGFEMWVFRRILRIPWTAHRTNISVLEELGIRTRLLKRINQAYLRYFGHIARQRDTMEKLVVEGKVNGTRPRGRSPNRWIDQLRPLVGSSIHGATHLALDRGAWSNQVKSTVASP